MAAEVARYWRHEAVDGVDLLRARFLTHRYGRHSHETYTFGLIEAGVEEFEYGGSLLRASAGAVALLDPDVVHTGQAATPAGWSYRVLYPEVSVVADVAAELGWPAGTPHFPQTVLTDPATAVLLRTAHQAAEHGDQLASSTLLRGTLAGLLLAHAAGGPAAAPCPARRAPAAVRAVKDLLAERLADPPALAELAAGLPPHAYLNQLRVRRSRLLLDDGIPAAAVAAQVGFADQAHLTRHFKRVVGVPPAAYQRERRQPAR
jgi:AraC-like DNA-binding protein